MIIYFLFELLDCKAPDAIAIYPLNGEYTTKEINGRTPQGIAMGVSLADGPDGKLNGSYQFHGNNESYIELHNNGSLKVQHSITMLCWVNFLTNTSGTLFLYGSSSENFVGMYINGNKLFAHFTDKEDQSTPNTLSTELELNQWHYVGASYDHVTGNESLWVNGTRKTQKIFKASMTLATGSNVRMGSILLDKSVSFDFAGRIAAMQVYNFTLTEQQIEAVKYAGDRGKNVNSNILIRSYSVKTCHSTSCYGVRWDGGFPHMGYIDMCCCEKYGFQSCSFVWDRQLIETKKFCSTKLYYLLLKIELTKPT